MTQRHARLRPGKLVGVGIVGVALIVAACGSSKKAGTGTTAANSSSTAASTTAAGPTTTAVVPVNTTAAPTGDKPVMGGKLTIAVEAETGNAFDPRVMNCDEPCQLRTRTVFEPLMVLDGNFQMQPFLAESVTPDATFTNWTIKLRPNIKFSDGTPLNADAAVFDLDGYRASPLNGPALLNIASDAKVDDLTFTITTHVPWPALPYYLGGGVASPTWLKSVDAKTGDVTHMVGTGPFMFDSYTPGQSLIVKKNPNYWRKDKLGNQLPYLDSIEMRVIEDAPTREKALEAGDVDVISTDRGDTIVNFRKQKDQFPMIELSQLGETFYELFHVDQAPFDDQNARCAFAAAIDKQGLEAATGGGIHQIANGPFSPGQEGYLADNGSQPFDPVKAKAFVDAYKKAHGGQAPTTSLQTVTDQIALTAAQFVQQNLQDVGFKITAVKQVEQSAYITAALLGAKDFQAFAWRNHAGTVVDEQFLWWSSLTASPEGKLALNFGRLKDPVIDDNLNKARVEPDPVKRKAFAEAINREFAAQCWIIPTSWDIWAIPHKANVTGFDKDLLPDGNGVVYYGQGFAGEFQMDTVWIKK